MWAGEDGPWQTGHGSGVRIPPRIGHGEKNLAFYGQKSQCRLLLLLPAKGRVERCGWADGVGHVFLHPSLLSPPFSSCPGDNYGVGFVASLADFWGLQRGWFPPASAAGFVSPKSQGGDGWAAEGAPWLWLETLQAQADSRDSRNHCPPDSLVSFLLVKLPALCPGLEHLVKKTKLRPSQLDPILG